MCPLIKAFAVKFPKSPRLTGALQLPKKTYMLPSLLCFNNNFPISLTC